MSDRVALAMVRVALKGARGLALDAGEDVLDQEFANAIEAIDRLAEAALPVPALDAYTAEMERARAKFGDQFDFTDTEWLAVLTEEVGESATETLRAKFFDRDALFRRSNETGVPIEESDYPLARLDKELVQVAAVAMRWRAALHVRAALAKQEADPT